MPEQWRLPNTGEGRSGALFSDRVFDVVEAVEALAKEKGCSPSQLALAWNMHQPGITSPIIGPRTMDQLVDNLGALDVEITETGRGKLDEIAPPGRAIVPYYEADWSAYPPGW